MKDVARFLKVLADETRLQMLWLLLNEPEICVCDILEALEITQSKASRHLATLRHAGLVTDRREAAWSYYSLRPLESELQRALLDTLQLRLAHHPGAEPLLRRLQERLQRRRGGNESDPCRADGGDVTPPQQRAGGGT